MSDGRKLAIAKQCKLLTGSYDGATRSCPCLSPNECHLTPEEREEFKDHPLVKFCAERNLKEYEQCPKGT
jgi:hypothetical protein